MRRRCRQGGRSAVAALCIRAGRGTFRSKSHLQLGSVDERCIAHHAHSLLEIGTLQLVRQLQGKGRSRPIRAGNARTWFDY